jgi:4'-phosphopantetheinyl transferase
MDIYSISCQAPLPEYFMAGFVAGLPAGDRRRFNSYRRCEDANNFVFGRYLLQRALREGGIPFGLSDLCYTSYGKPYFREGPDFSISHSGSRVVCLISSDGRVGIDLEEIRQLPLGDFQAQFSRIEWNNIQYSSSPLSTFFHYWTAKESVAKADGRGLSLGLAGISVTGPRILVGGKVWQTRTVAIAENYACHVAVEAEERVPRIFECRIAGLEGVRR